MLPLAGRKWNWGDFSQGVAVGLGYIALSERLNYMKFL